MKTTFLDYYKMVLEKVSFDRQLFMKEYRKALGRLSENEVANLNTWLQSRPHMDTFFRVEHVVSDTVAER